MKVLMLNGSPHEKGCTYTALNEIAKTLSENGIESEIFWMGREEIKDCVACGGCAIAKNNRCIFNGDAVNTFLEKAEKADGFVFGSPVYYAHASGRVLSLLDRVFYSGSRVFRRKPCAVIASARRAGTTCAIDDLMKYPTISEMIVVSSQYWNMVHGAVPEQVLQDEEGLQTMRVLARNMAWLMKSLECAEKSGIEAPEREKRIFTNFIR